MNKEESFLDKYKSDISHELIEFVESEQFKKFTLIMENMYLSQLQRFHIEKDEKEIVLAQKVLNIYASLPKLLQIMAQEALENKRAQRDKE